MDNNQLYIKPSIRTYVTFDELKEDIDKYGNIVLFRERQAPEFSELLLRSKTVILGEPGVGKTRFLTEFLEYAKSQKIPSAWTDLKATESGSLEKSIKLQVDPRKNCIILLDALDEIRQDQFAFLVNEIKQFEIKYKKARVFISCRINYLLKYPDLFSNSEYRYVNILPFSYEQVSDYLQSHGITKQQVDFIFSALRFDHGNYIIQTPRYLELFVDFIKEKGTANIASLSRSDLFEYFIYKNLELEDNRLNLHKREIIKRFLEKLALVMEIYQTNTMTTTELATVLEKLDTDIKEVFASQVPLEIFYEKGLLKYKADKETIEFYNTEFQEYLAAKEISGSADPNRLAFDLAVTPELQEIHPSWNNTLTFLIDIKPEVAEHILNFIKLSNNDRAIDEGFFKFITRINAASLPTPIRKKIFGEILDYHQTTLQWMPGSIAENLAYYYDDSLYPKLIDFVEHKKFDHETQRFVQLGNVTYIISGLLKNGLLQNSKQKTYWKEKLLAFAQDSNDNGVLQRHAFEALEFLGDPTVINELSDKPLSHNDELVGRGFINMCAELDANNPKSVRYFIEGIKHGSIEARHGIYKVTAKGVLKTFLQNFSSDVAFAVQFFDKASIFKDEDAKIAKNISKVWDKDFKKLSEELLVRSFGHEFGYHSATSVFLIELGRVLYAHNKNFLPDFIKLLKSSGEIRTGLFYTVSFFEALLDAQNAEDFIKAMIDAGEEFSCISVLQRIKLQNKPGSDKIYEKGRKFFPKEYADYEKARKKGPGKQSDPDLSTYKEFKKYLDPAPKQYYPSVFEFYHRHQKQLDKFLTKADKDRLSKLAVEEYLGKIDPVKYDLHITQEAGDATSFTINSGVHVFGDALIVAHRLGVNLRLYRQNIINYIPYAHYDDLQVIFEAISNIQEEELQPILEVYKGKHSDLWRYEPDSFVEFCKKNEIKSGIPILQVFVDEEKFKPHIRLNALETAALLGIDKKFLVKVFKKFQKSLPQLSDKANELLINIHSDRSALLWRMQAIIKRVQPFVSHQGVHSVSDLEDELTHGKHFAQALAKFVDPKYQTEYLKLLDQSLVIYKKGKDYYAYTQYIWEIVLGYFDNLKTGGSYKPYMNLAKHSVRYSLEGSNWLVARLRQIKQSYVQYLGKPKNINDAINIYNRTHKEDAPGINTPTQLHQKIQEIINVGLRNWIESQGAYSFIVGKKIKTAERQNYEDLIQKTIKSQMEAQLYKQGFVEADIHREVQLLDGKKVDFLIGYGFIGSIPLELKLTTHSDLHASNLAKTESFNNLVQYMKGYGAENGIFLVIHNDPKVTAGQLKKVEKAFNSIKGVKTIILDSTKDKSIRP